VFGVMEDHNLKRLLDRGVAVTINSDDPAYFGGYLTDNYLAIQRALDLSRDDLMALARNSIEAAFLDDPSKAVLLAELTACAAG
jgi:adenosine deaminase